MTQRIIGERPSQRRWRFRFLFLPILLGAALALFAGRRRTRSARHGRIRARRERDQRPAVNGDDWDKVCHQVTAIATARRQATRAARRRLVDGGAEPERHDLHRRRLEGPAGHRDWAWKDGRAACRTRTTCSTASRPATRCRIDELPDAVSDGTAATCEVLFFGSDRFDNSGDAQQGFWFFQNQITPRQHLERWRLQLQRRAQAVTCWSSATSATAARHRRSPSTSGTRP